jgi:cell wall-associated NlpC family hydrolase
MPSHRAPKISPRKTSAFAIAGVAAGSVLLMQPGSAQAETMQQAKADYNAKMAQSEVATEAYDAAETQAAQLQQKINTLQGQIAKDTADMASLQKTMGLQAAQQYESGGMSDSLKLAFESSPQSYLDQALTSSEVSSQEARLLKQLTADKAQIAQDQKLAASEMAQQNAAVANARTQKNKALAATAAAKQTISNLTAAQQQQITSGGGSSLNSVNVPAPNSRAAAAVAYAKSKLGDAYVYAAAGPSTFDCSGLTMMAWEQAGVSLPHNAAAQYDSITHISLSEAQPGDLLFFYDGSTIGHVGIYIGNDTLIDAPRPGLSVREITLGNIGMTLAGVGRV